jgi:predicted nucleotidyltransferase
MYTKAQIQVELEQIVKDLLPYHPEQIILFGSIARGDYHEFSDIDLLIVKNTDTRFIDRIGEVYELLQTRMPVEPLVYTEDELNTMLNNKNGFIENVMKEGVTLYGQQCEGSNPRFANKYSTLYRD